MDINLLTRHIADYIKIMSSDSALQKEEVAERQERIAYYQTWTTERMLKMTQEDVYEYISKLWAMRIWGNKQYAVNKILESNGLEKVRRHLADLAWGSAPVSKRWDEFRGSIKSVGPAMMSEILCHVRPETCMLWNRRAYVGLDYLGVTDLPRYDYQLTGKKYESMSKECLVIAQELTKAGLKDVNLLTVDYFIWSELQMEENLSTIHKEKPESVPAFKSLSEKTSEFAHNDIRDKIADIGTWLGFSSNTEKKVASGSQVDTVWEATIGNMGRVIYIFEVQTKGSIDSLLMNLLKSLNNPAVQGVVAVSDKEQLKKIKDHAREVPGLRDKLKFWDYEEVLQVHQSLAAVNESINKLGLVPQGF